MLTGGFYAEIELTYDPTIAQESKGRPFGVASLREIQISKRDVLDTLGRGREMFSLEEWKRFLLRSCGLEPEKMNARACDIVLLRMVRSSNATTTTWSNSGPEGLEEPPLSAGLAVRASCFRRQDDGRQDVSSTTPTGNGALCAFTTWCVR